MITQTTEVLFPHDKLFTLKPSEHWHTFVIRFDFESKQWYYITAFGAAIKTFDVHSRYWKRYGHRISLDVMLALIPKELIIGKPLVKVPDGWPEQKIGTAYPMPTGNSYTFASAW